MPHFPQSVGDNIQYLQQQIHRQGTASLGPVSVGPGEGHIRLYADTGDTGRLDPSGISIKYRGSLRGLTPLTEDFADLMESHTRTLAEHIGRLNGIDGRLDGHDSTLASHGNRLGSAESRLDRHDSAISSHNTRINNAQSAANTANSRAGSLEGRASTLESNISAHNKRINNAQSAANAAQSRADSAYSRAGTGISDAAAAHARANAAYTLASGRATQTQINNLRQENDRLKTRVAKLEAWRDSLPPR